METKSYTSLAPETLAQLDPNTSYAKIRDMVGSGRRVLDIGCGPGNLAAVLRQAGNVVVGIDIDERGLQSARAFCERTIKADVEHEDLADLVGDDRFDVIVFADVVEHLRHPARLLTSSRALLRDSGYIVASVPNIAHGAVRLALLRGRFDYQQVGILDDTHLRFYTRESVARLLSESGLTSIRIERTTAPVFESSDLVPLVRRDDFDEALVSEILSDEDAETLQFIVRAAPLADADALDVLRSEISDLEHVVRTLRAELAQAREGRAPLSQPGRVIPMTGGGRASSDRVAEVEQHYRNALTLAEATRAERDAALSSAHEARTEAERLRAAAAQRERDGAAELQQVRTELARLQGLAEAMRGERDAATAVNEALSAEVEHSRAQAAEQSARYAAGTVLLASAEFERDGAQAEAEQLRARADDARSEADANRRQLDQTHALYETAHALAEARRVHLESAQYELEAARAQLAAVQGRLEEAHAQATVVHAELDDARAQADDARAQLGDAHAQLAALQTDLAGTQAQLEPLRGEAGAATARAADAERAAEETRAALAELGAYRDSLLQRIADLEGRLEALPALVQADVESRDAALRQRLGALEDLLATERATRFDVEQTCARLEVVARRRAAVADEAELARLQARSLLVDVELRMARAAERRDVVALARPPVTPPVSTAMVRAGLAGRRTVALLPRDERAERQRARWSRVKNLLSFRSR